MVGKTMVQPKTIQNPWLIVKPWFQKSANAKHVDQVQYLRSANLFFTFSIYFVGLKLRIIPV